MIKYYVSYITGKMCNERTIYIQCLRFAIAILKLEKCENLLHGKLNTYNIGNDSSKTTNGLNVMAQLETSLKYSQTQKID